MTDDQSRSEEGKRFPLNMRTTRDVREKIERAAKKSGRSMSQEVEYRIERSFADQELIELAARNAASHTLEVILGTGHSRKLLVAFASAIKTIETMTGKQFSEDEYTKTAVSQAMWLIFRTWHGAVSDENFSDAQKRDMFEMTRMTASFACGLIDLQSAGLGPAWADKNLPKE